MTDAWLAGWGGVAAAGLATYVWRALGVMLARRIDPDSAVFEWIGCVSYAMLAGLIARMLVMPAGALAETPLTDRLVATAAAFALFYLAGRSLLIATFGGVGLFALLMVARQGGLFGA